MYILPDDESDEEDQMLATDHEDDDCDDSMGAEVVYISSDEDIGMCDSLLFRLLRLSVVCLSCIRSWKLCEI